MFNGNFAHGVTDLKGASGINGANERFSGILFNTYKRQKVANENEERSRWKAEWADDYFPYKAGEKPKDEPSDSRKRKAVERFAP